MLTSQELTAILRDNGYKVTPQRLAVYEALANEQTHPTAEQLYSKLHPRFPSMSFATVYKTVEILNNIKVIQIINTGEDSFRYDADVSVHHHVQCRVCGAVHDVTALDSRRLVRDVEKKSGFEIEHHQFFFYGVCADCRSKRH